MHWELLEENSGVFYSDMLDEYFIADDTSIAPGEVKRIIRSHSLLQPKYVEEDEDAYCSVQGEHEDTSADREDVNKIISLHRCCVPLLLLKPPMPVLSFGTCTLLPWLLQFILPCRTQYTITVIPGKYENLDLITSSDGRWGLLSAGKCSMVNCKAFAGRRYSSAISERNSSIYFGPYISPFLGRLAHPSYNCKGTENSSGTNAPQTITVFLSCVKL
ncbi:hypothetical protein DAPPUDRAFT_106759 [Daphnia pulex]|uniref:Uncharacterized protein n=1 Tax=Daphnia pulex TaxID=6669 RepID=E9GUI2_DAPPU|nr:hypothetical protein DAPPUDRAFT_106759 [Daphnia pulex]|eukprot:EFX76843.1 hypothetical protein DAPPUDRAFT_106759 [Daphnia pulex]